MWVLCKNGKIELVVGVLLFVLMGDNEVGVEVYLFVMNEDQVKLVFDIVVVMVGMFDLLVKWFEIYKGVIFCFVNMGLIKVLMLKVWGKYGLNLFVFIGDEVYEWVDLLLYMFLY